MCLAIPHTKQVSNCKASLLRQSQTGFIRGDRFRNSGDITGYGSFYFTGHTNFQSAGTMMGDDTNNPILFFDESQTGDQIFDVYVLNNPPVNVIRPESMPPLDITSYDCTAPPSVAGYPPTTTVFNETLCAPAPSTTFSLDTPHVEPHAPVDGQSFTILYNTIRLFEQGNASNPTNNSTSLIIPGKGTFTYDQTTRVITFTPNPAFVGTVVAQYRISNSRNGDSIVYPSGRTDITVTIDSCSATPRRKVISNPMLPNKARRP